MKRQDTDHFRATNIGLPVCCNSYFSRVMWLRFGFLTVPIEPATGVPEHRCRFGICTRLAHLNSSPKIEPRNLQIQVWVDSGSQKCATLLPEK